jgi:aryl carrier-like protein
MGVLPTRRALEALERLLEEGAVQAGVMPTDWASWHRAYGSLAAAPYLSLLISGIDSGTPSQTADGVTRERILGARSETRAAIVESYLAKQTARILKVPLASVDRETPILQMGFDSLMSIELKNKIETDLGVSIGMARLIQGPTLVELTDWVMHLLVAAQSAIATTADSSSVGEFEEGVL